jgi:hypothetical protein
MTEEDSDDDESDGEHARKKKAVRMDKSVTWSLQLDDEGWPILPPSGDLTTPDLKDIIRSFLTLTYRK